MKLEDIKKAHFVGIGGIGMSALARLFVGEGIAVSGSDRSRSIITEALKKEGVNILNEQGPENILNDLDLVVYTEAMQHDHPELAEALIMGIPTMNYFDALGMVANEYYLIAVAGSHGKTTTTAMLLDIFEEAKLDPSGIVGSLRAKTKSNYQKGKSKYFIVEACEYKRDFLSLQPDILVITNIEHEHVDYYKDLHAVQDAFAELARTVPEDGFVIANTNDIALKPVLKDVRGTIVDYTSEFDPLLTLTAPGVHNQMNAAAATAAARAVDIPKAVCKKALEAFSGTWRRFEYKGEVNGAPVYDDYGHHPTEVRATLRGARERYPHKNITLVFEPHTYSRAEELFSDFVDTLSEADTVILAPIYAAREENVSGVSSEKLREAIRVRGTEVEVIDKIQDIVKAVRNTANTKTVILVMGAGTITEVATLLTK